MQAYLGGQPVTFVFPLVDSDGVAIATSSVSYRLIDQNEVELVAKTALSSFLEGDETVTVEISGLLNTLALGETRGMRIIEVYVTNGIGTIKLESGYLIEAEEVLVENKNSFQSYTKAMYGALEIPNIPGWSNASKTDRIAALIAARRNIAQLRFRYVFDAYQNIVDNTVGVSDLTLTTADQWAALPQDFKEAVCRAQILEADMMLGGDEIGDIRRAGLMSMTVGEAKQFFRTTKAIDGLVCKRAMKELAKFVQTRHRLSRS